MTTGVPETRNERLVVVGGGQAATQMIEVARQQGFEGSVTLLSEEPVLPYQRPPLSKQYLGGLHDEEWLLYRPNRFYDKYAINVRLGARATQIDRVRHTVTLQDGTTLGYDKLALATGARARRFPGPGADHEHVFYIRTLADVDGLRARLPETRTAVIIGGGFIGLETAAVLVQMGIEVTLVAAQDSLLPKAVAGPVASFLRDQHLQHGVKIVLGAQVAALHGKSSGTMAVVLADGAAHEGDIVVVGIGAIPNVELAEAAGLDLTMESLSTRWHGPAIQRSLLLEIARIIPIPCLDGGCDWRPCTTPSSRAARPEHR